jgi:hypothetical protein
MPVHKIKNCLFLFDINWKNVIMQEGGEDMKFFVPFAVDEAEAESVYRCFAEFIHAPIVKKRIWKLTWEHKGIINHAEVGKSITGDSRFGGEPVLAVFELTTLYLICTPNRGGVRGEPIFAGKNDNSTAIYFE